MRTGRPKRLKLEERQELARRYHAGETPKVLADAYGVSRRHVTRLAKEERGDGLAVRDPSERVSFRASRSEVEAFDAEWRARGFANRSQALHALLRGRCGFLDVHRDQIVGFAAAWRQAQDITDAGRGLAKAVHRGRLVLSADDLATLSAFLDTAQCMSRELTAMKAVARNQRGQGWSPAGSEAEPGTEEQEAPFERSGLMPSPQSLPFGTGEAGGEAQGGDCGDALYGRSGSGLNPQSLPLADARTRLGMHDAFLKNRNTRNV